MILMASDLLIVAILVRMCWRCVVSLGLSLIYMYRFLAVLESCTYIRGWFVGRSSMPRFRASVSAVFMLVSDAPIILGRYVTRVSIGFIFSLNHAVDCIASGDVVSIRHSVAAAVIMGYLRCSVGGVKPPSTAINRGEHDSLIRDVIGCRSGRIAGFVCGSKLRVPCDLKVLIAL